MMMMMMVGREKESERKIEFLVGVYRKRERERKRFFGVVAVCSWQYFSCNVPDSFYAANSSYLSS